jgi:hypothetical protein
MSPREMVNHPDHYGGDKPYEVIKVLEAWNPYGAYWFCRMNAIKYLARLGLKEGADPLEDHKKAEWYANEARAIVVRNPNVMFFGDPKAGRRNDPDVISSWNEVESIVGTLHRLRGNTPGGTVEHRHLERTIRILEAIYHSDQQPKP